MVRLLLIVVLLLSGCADGENGDTNNVSLESGNLLLGASHGENGSAWGLPDCSACHALKVIHKDAGLIRGIVRDKGYSTCTGCHGRNGSLESEPRRCGVCHNRSDLRSAPILQGQHGHVFSVGASGAINDEQCLTCHQASDMDGVFELNTDLTIYPDANLLMSDYQRLSEFCVRCHNRDHQQSGFAIEGKGYDDPLIAVEEAFRYVDRHGLVDGSGERTYAGLHNAYLYRSVVECTDCHAMHGTDNDKLIIDSSLKGVTQLDPSLRSKPYRINTSNGNYSQLCVLCHQMSVVLDEGESDTGNGLSGVHQVGSDCRPCHTHGEAVQAGL